jgi:NDP-hexose-3-ketoreductase
VTRGERRVRIGVLGCADIAWRRMLPAMATVPGISIAAVSSRSPEKARRFADEFGAQPYTDHEAVLTSDDIDAVYLPLPTGMHADWAKKALAAGKHVLCEKPLTVTYPQAAELVAEAGRAGLRLMENFMFLHHSQHEEVRRTLTAGTIGELRTVNAAFGIPPLTPTDVRYDPALGGGALLDVGVYPRVGDRTEQRMLAADHQFANSAASFARAVLDGGAPTSCEGEHILRRARLVDRIREVALRVPG